MDARQARDSRPFPPDPSGLPAEATEFVRYCYEQRPSPWPELYDEMCAVAARGAFRGWGFVELAERGISFDLVSLRHLAALAEQVAREEHEAGDGRGRWRLSPAAGR